MGKFAANAYRQAIGQLRAEFLTQARYISVQIPAWDQLAALLDPLSGSK
jgi:hypothetical protein